MANERIPETAGPQVAQSGKRTKRYSRRIILVFIAFVGVLLVMITMQARFKGDTSPERSARNYRAPQAAGFAELAANMRRDRRPVQVATPEIPAVPVSGNRRQRIVIEGARATPVSPQPRYYSNRNDAQAANTLRTMKMQALTAKPLIDGFGQDENGPAGTGARGISPDGAGAVQVNRTPQAMDSTTMAALMQQQAQMPDLNGQAQKQNFLRGANGGGSMTPQGYSQNLPVPQQFPYELKAGTIIPGMLISGINSDLPGNVIGQVSENVWDTATGRFVLIPKGTRILGVYSSEVSFGQRRVLLVWNRLIFPNGTTLNISGSPGVDQAGYSGLSGKVNEHWGTMFKTALLASMFVAGAEIVYDRDSQGSNENKSPGDMAAESVAGSILDMSAKIMNRATDIQPTITIRPGKKMGIFVQQDIVFPFPYF
jgi:type IV secretion system protein VirB10